jgi:hypothetical protein
MTKFFLFIFILLFWCAKLKNEKPVIPQRKVWIDDTFTSGEIQSINNAFRDWRKATHNTVDYVIAGTISHKLIKYESIHLRGMAFASYKTEKFFIFRAAENDEISQEANDALLGLALTDTIILFVDSIGSTREFERTLKHEMGHTLRLKHNLAPFSLMYSTCVENYCEEPGIPKIDVIMLCLKVQCK